MNLQDIQNDINGFINGEQYTEASNLYLSTIEELRAQHSPLLPEFCYNYANLLFNLYEYELSLSMFQQAYNQGFKRQEIESFLYDSFVHPNNNEFQETYNTHFISYSDHIVSSNLPTYDELSLDFIPLDEDKYYIFNKTTKTFDGMIDLTPESLGIFQSVNFEDEFSDIVMAGTWNIYKLKNCILSNPNRKIYFISTDIKQSLSFLKLPSFIERFCPNATFIDSANSFQAYFHQNTSEYLPHLFYGKCSDEYSSAISKIIEQEHRYRLTPEGRNTTNVILTIGIPTYNRGHRALHNIQNLLQSQFDAEIEFLVSNNGSTKYVEEYDELSKIEDSRIYYFRYPENVGSHLNFCNVLGLSHGRYTCLLSDEDSIVLSSISHYLHVLRSNPNISFATGGGLFYYKHSSCSYYLQGHDAFLNSFLNTNYITGLIYRSDLVHQQNIYQWTLEHMHYNKGVESYPHSCWVMFFTLCGDYYEDSLRLFTEGQAEEDAITYPINNSASAKAFLSYTTVESRIEQHNGFIEVLNELNMLINKETFLTAYLILCDKTIFLLSLVKKSYIEYGVNWNDIHQKALNCSYTGIDRLDLSLDDNERDMLIVGINSIYEGYKD